MIIAHFAPFAPNRCGLYEAARDMVKADVLSGNTVYFIDTGITVNGKKEEPKVGVVDNRANFNLQTADHEMINYADIAIMHTGVIDSWLVSTQTPLIWVIHGRPLACIRHEQNNIKSYALYKELNKWKRIKKFVYFWPEFTTHWENMIDINKLKCFDYPVIDETRFNNLGEVHNFENKGTYNILICDSSRNDIDLYELMVGCIEAAKVLDGFKFQFYGVDHPINDSYQVLFDRLKQLGSLGDVVGRIGDLEKVYRAADCLMSPNRIITRTIGESLSCGTPVISQLGCNVADYTCDMANSKDVLEALLLFKQEFDRKMIYKDEIINRASVFKMDKYSEEMNKLYNEVYHE